MSVEYVRTDESAPPVAVVQKPRWTPARIALWAAIAIIAGLGWVMIAIVRGEDGGGPLSAPRGASG